MRTSRTGPTCAILTEALSKSYGSREAVRQVSLRVEERDIFGFIGPNGAGKTTVLRMLTGVLEPSSGRAWVLGADVRREPERVKSLIAYLPQSEVLYGDLTASENVRFALSLYGVPRADRAESAREALELCGLGALAERRASTLSGGERRLLALCAAIAPRQALLVLDEPTAGLDPERRALVWDVLHRLREAGATILVTTHAMDEADRCLHVGLMGRGRLLAAGRTPDELRVLFPWRLFEIAGAAGQVDALRRALPLHQVSIRGAKVRIATDLAEARDVERSLVSAGLALGVRAVEPDLEDVFLALTSGVER